MAIKGRKMIESAGMRLDRRLDDYSSVTRVSVAANKSRSRIGNWPVYAAAAGSALAMATNASADIIYCGASDNYCEPASHHPVLTATAAGPEINIPLFHTASHQVILDASLLGGGVSFNASVFAAKVRIFNSTFYSNFADNFTAGAPIGAGVAANLAAQGLIFEATAGGSAFGNFRSGVPGFAGLALSSIGGVPGNTDYGWIRLMFNDQNGAVPESLTAIDWAIDTTSGETIQAGQMPVSTPEPRTLDLLLLASGATGVEVLRRRRKA